MRKVFILMPIVLSLAGCTASIGTPPTTTRTTYSTPAVTTYDQPAVTQTTVTETND